MLFQIVFVNYWDKFFVVPAWKLILVKGPSLHFCASMKHRAQPARLANCPKIMFFSLLYGRWGTPCTKYLQYPWGYSATVRHIISTCELYQHYQWDIPAVLVRKIISTCHNVSRTCNIHEDIQCSWGILLIPMRHIISNHEWISSVPISIFSTVRESHWMKNEWTFTHVHWISSRVLQVYLMGTDNCTDNSPHGYWQSSSWVIQIYLTGTDAMPHKY